MYKIGVMAGNYDIIHPGYIYAFKEAKSLCDKFIILLHTDPSIERPEKLKPVLSIKERLDILHSIRYIDFVIQYDTEKDLLGLLKWLNPDVRFIGDDYRDKRFTGDDLGITTHYINRDHGWSTTKFKTLISKTL
jgi:glycerol-3-phosphate cytidylyltransferase